MEKIIDLHIHSNISDGILSPKEIIDKAYKNNIKVISITDHDSIDAYTKELFDYAKNKNIEIINGVEISSKNDKVGVHILGYNFNLENKKLKEKLKELRDSRQKYLCDVKIKLNELGFILNLNELKKIEIVTKAHISMDIINNDKNKEALILTFNHIPNKGEFIETIMNEGCPAYVKKFSISPKEASILIKEAGGKVVLAHPVAYKYEDNLNQNDVQQLINNIKPNGLETNYIYIDRNNNKIDEIKYWKNIAIKNNLFETLGSDFHMEDNIHPTIGLINENINLTELEINEILNFLNK